MNLKEAYRYSNFLEDVLTESYEYLANPEFITTTEQKHLRSKVVKEAEDETTTVTKDFDTEYTPTEIIDICVQALEEKEKLAKAIADAKAQTEINIDNAIDMNKRKHRFVEVLKRMASVKGSTKNVRGVGYRFNVNNEQVQYYYNIEETKSIHFDRNHVKKLIKKYCNETDGISAKLDAIEINTIVDFVPKWDMNGDIEY